MIGYCLLCITVLATTKILLFKVQVRKALLKGNLSVAITVGGICIATSINLRVSVFACVIIEWLLRCCLFVCLLLVVEVVAAKKKKKLWLTIIF